MLTITCPFCGPRSENEFVHGGPARVIRPEYPDDYDNQAWIDYLTHQPNPVGPTREKWWHVRGCGAWITIQRDTTTHAIAESVDETLNARRVDTRGDDQVSTSGDTQSDNTAS